jgi:hypothetical protein
MLIARSLRRPTAESGVARRPLIALMDRVAPRAKTTRNARPIGAERNVVAQMTVIAAVPDAPWMKPTMVDRPCGEECA